MLVIPDTNVLFADPFLAGPLIRTILAAENRTNLRLVIPEVVIDELRGHVEERLKKNVDAVSKAQRDYSWLSGSHPNAVRLAIGPKQRRIVLDRFDQLVQRLSEEGRILEYPKTTPKDLARRSIAVQAPFQENDRGFRDSLIWLNVMECLKGTATGSQKITLVTDDKAFWNKKKTALNESLGKELDSAGIPRESLSVRLNLQEVIGSFISSNLSSVEWVATAIEGGSIKDFTASDDTVPLKITDWIYGNPDIFVDPYGYIGGYLFVEFDVIEDVHFECIERTLDLGHDEVLVDSSWTCFAAVQGFHGPVFGEGVTVALQFTLSSIVESKNDHLSVRSHQVTDVTVGEFLRDEPTLWP